MDTDYCLCGKRVILNNGVPSNHRSKAAYGRSRKERKAMWCDVWKRMVNVAQPVLIRKNEGTLDKLIECQLLQAA